MSLWYRIKLATVAAGKALNITGSAPFTTPADSIGQKWFSRLFLREDITPSVVVTTELQVPLVIGGSNDDIEWEFPVILWILDGASPNDDPREELYQEWHETIRKAFNQKALAGVPEVHDCTVDVTPIFDRALPQYQKVRMGIRLKFKAMEPR